MIVRATYRSPDGFFTGLFVFVLGLGVISGPFWLSEADFLGTRARRGGIFKLIEQAIGWELFSLLFVLFGVWLVLMGLSALWKGIDKTPDVSAFDEHLEFHPAIRKARVPYDEVSHWELRYSSGHPVLTINFHEPFFSLQSKFKRRDLPLEGGKEDLEELFNFFANHPDMRTKFVR